MERSLPFQPIRSLLMIITATIMLMSPSGASAFDWLDAYNSQLNTSQYYDPNDLLCSGDTDVPTDLIGNDNIQKAYNYFVQRGLTPAQSSGIVGNLRQESGVNPSMPNKPANSPYGGIAQWEGSRMHGPNGLLAAAAKAGKPWNDLGLQLDFLWKEMPGQTAGGHVDELKSILPQATSRTNSLEAVKMSNDVETATKAFEYTFERAGDPRMATRIKYAKEVLAMYGGGETPGPGGGNDNGTSTCIPGPGGGNFLDGFTVYNQCDPAWANKPYGSSTICPSGCGPSAMAMIITALTGSKVTPDVTAAYAGSKGLYIPGTGSSWNIAPVLAAHWNLKATFIGANLDKITSTLRSGGLVITSGSGAKPFTSGGHYIVIRGITDSGKFKVGDSGHKDTSDKEWDPNQILVNMNNGSVYAITK